MLPAALRGLYAERTFGSHLDIDDALAGLREAITLYMTPRPGRECTPSRDRTELRRLALDSHRVTELEPGIVELELTRPHRRNALSSNAVAELHREIDRIGGDPAIRVVILTGEGTVILRRCRHQGRSD